MSTEYRVVTTGHWLLNSMRRNITVQSNTPLPESLIKAAPEGERELVRFPAEDRGESLSAMAQRDLESALQLLAERAQYITGAAGAAIALRSNGSMICRASVGDCAPALGLGVQTDSGLSGESVRTRQILRCDNAEDDPRVNRESCRALGISSVVVLPLVANDEVNGLFELFSAKPYAFEERDIVALQRLSEMVQTALEHADAVKVTEAELAEKPTSTAEVEPEVKPDPPPPSEPAAVENKIEPEPAPVKMWSAPADGEAAASEEEDAPVNLVITERGNIRKCLSCGFPVSEGRELCVDCEGTRGGAIQTDLDTPAFLSDLAGSAREGWFESHKYLVAVVVLLGVLLAVLLWLR